MSETKMKTPHALYHAVNHASVLYKITYGTRLSVFATNLTLSNRLLHNERCYTITKIRNLILTNNNQEIRVFCHFTWYFQNMWRKTEALPTFKLPII